MCGALVDLRAAPLSLRPPASALRPATDHSRPHTRQDTGFGSLPAVLEHANASPQEQFLSAVAAQFTLTAPTTACDRHPLTVTSIPLHGTSGGALGPDATPPPLPPF